MSSVLPDREARAQKTRLRRTLFAAGGGGAFTAVVLLIHTSGGLRLEATDLAMVLTGFWLVNLVFIGAILTGLNRRLPDPSMTLAQMLWATISTFAILYFVDDGRHLVLMVYLLAMMFGAFRLDVSEYLLVTLSALVLYGLVIAALTRLHPASVEGENEALNWFVFFIVMVGFSLLGSETSRMRSALQRRNWELQEARDAAATANHAKSRFLATTSHELRTPLNMIVGAADVIGERGMDEEQRDALARARNAGGHLLSLVNSMIDLSKLEAGDLELRPAAFDLRRHLDDIHGMVTPLAEDRGIELVLDVSPDLAATVEGDPIRLNEVLVHLLSNSIKFTESGEVRLSAGRDTSAGTRMRFSVADTGRGIEPRVLASLFQPFTPGDVRSTRAHGGSGLGLALCRQLVELMGGTLEAHSTVDQGSRFSFAVPLPEVAPESHLDEDQSQGMRVLVVDDSPDNRLLMLAFLKGIVASIDTAENGIAGVDLFAREHYDVVLMDMLMPEMNGLEATRAMREVEHQRGDSPCAAILALTADDSVIDRKRSLEAGCDDHLVKPISKKALIAAIMEHAPDRAAQ
jgi:signal transduction histidine kinase/ActR/RegA family two-component response regulator